MPRVHIDSIDPRVILFMVPHPEERAALSPAYRERGIPMCRPPCDKVIDGHEGRVFFVERHSSAFDESERFRLDDLRGNVTLRVGDREMYHAGAGLIGVGGVTTAIGLGFIIGSFFEWIGGGWIGSSEQARTQTHLANEHLWAGQGLVAGGMLPLFGGLTLMMASKIRVELDRGTPKRAESAVRFDGRVFRF